MRHDLTNTLFYKQASRQRPALSEEEKSVSPSAVRCGSRSPEVASPTSRESWPASVVPLITHRVVTSHEVAADGRIGRVTVEVAINTQVGVLLRSQLVKIEVTP